MRVNQAQQTTSCLQWESDHDTVPCIQATVKWPKIQTQAEGRRSTDVASVAPCPSASAHSNHTNKYAQCRRAK